MNKVLGLIHMLIAACVGAYYLVWPLLGDSASHEVWNVLNWAMAVAVLLSLYFAYGWMRGLGDDASTKEFIANKILFLGAVLLLLWYFPAWFTELAGSGRTEIEYALGESFWLLVDPLFVMVSGCVGFRLWSQS